MAFPELAYPEPGWLSRFVGRREYFKRLGEILDSTHRGATLPIVQIVGEEGIGKSWFLQRLRYDWRNFVDVPIVPLRLKIPAMTQRDKAIDAMMTRLINRWKLNLRLTEFALGRIAHLKGESIERFGTYHAALKYLPELGSQQGEKDMRRILVERGVDTLRNLWGPRWGKKFLSMSPAELSWYLPELFGLDIDPTVRATRLRAFVLLIDDADKIPEMYDGLLRMKRHSSLTLIILTSKTPLPTGKQPVELFELKPFSLLERRAYLYSLGVDEHKTQRKIYKKYGYNSISLAIGALEHRQLVKRNTALQQLIGALLICHRPSLDVVLQITKDQGTLSAFFAEPVLVDILGQPDRLPWRFMLHDIAQRWASHNIDVRPRPESPYGEIIERLSLFANRDFGMGMPVLYWFFRYSLARGQFDNATDAIMAANEVAINNNRHSFKLYNKLLLLDAFCPNFNDKLAIRYARHLVLWHSKNRNEDINIELVAAARCLLKFGRHRSALKIANSLLPKVSAKVMEERGMNAAYMLLRAEINRIIGLALIECGEPSYANAPLTSAREASVSAQNSSRALGDEATIMQIEVAYANSKRYISSGDSEKAWQEITFAVEQNLAILGGIKYRFIPMLQLADELLEFIFENYLWTKDIDKTANWLNRIISASRRYFEEKKEGEVSLKLLPMIVRMARIALEQRDTKQSMDWLSTAEVMLTELGEKYLWLSDYFHKLTVEMDILKAEIYAAMGNAPNSFDVANDGYNLIKRWHIDEDEDNLPLVAKVRIIGGLALARLEKFDDANIWLSAGVSIAEKIFRKRPHDFKLTELRMLCGDAYHELARMAIHEKKEADAERMAEMGIEHRLNLIGSVDSSIVGFQLGELYTLLLEAQNRINSQKISDTFEHAVSVLLTTCSKITGDKTRCIQLAESFFRLAMDVIKKNRDNSTRMKVLALSLVPIIKEPELRQKALEIRDELSNAKLPESLEARFERINSYISEMEEIGEF